MWTLPELQDLLDEWLICGWQSRPHDSLRDPWFPKRAISPNDAYAAMVAAAGYLPVTLTAEDYLELLPVTWRAINDYGDQKRVVRRSTVRGEVPISVDGRTSVTSAHSTQSAAA